LNRQPNAERDHRVPSPRRCGHIRPTASLRATHELEQRFQKLQFSFGLITRNLRTNIALKISAF
jgi:hypothetical protein